jgi:hypothetical protein
LFSASRCFLLGCLGALAVSTTAFVAPSHHATRQSFHVTSSKPSHHQRLVQPQSSLFASTGEDAVEEMSEERRQNLFQALLRDFQIEGVPLLGCDANQVHTMNAALWTTMAELSEQDEEQRACMVMENIPISALKSFASDFTILKTQNRLVDFMPELKRISVSVIGKGVGPAVLIETETRTAAEVEERNARMQEAAVIDENKCLAAMKAFVDRVVVGYKVCPYMKNTYVATLGPIGYRYSPTADTCGALSAFWNNICELLATPDDVLSSIVLSLPAIAWGTSREAHDRFAAVSELVSRNLCLFRGADVFSLVHFHPRYERNLIHPIEKPAYGHLPPQSWLPAMLRLNGDTAEADYFTDDDYFLSNYQRRAPHMAINILRVEQVEAAAGGQSIVDLDLGNGVVEKASGIKTYSHNAIELAAVGKESLESSLVSEIEMQY